VIARIQACADRNVARFGGARSARSTSPSCRRATTPARRARTSSSGCRTPRKSARQHPTSRDEDALDPDWRLHACLKSLEKLGIDGLVTIGGDNTTVSASRLAEAAGGGLRVAHVPKTIDKTCRCPAACRPSASNPPEAWESLDRLLARQVKDRFRGRGEKVTVEGKNIGYEVRYGRGWSYSASSQVNRCRRFLGRGAGSDVG
jgi:hypothetical protein